MNYFEDNLSLEELNEEYNRILNEEDYYEDELNQEYKDYKNELEGLEEYFGR